MKWGTREATREFLVLGEYLGVRSCYCFARIPEGYWQNSRWCEPPVTKSRSIPASRGVVNQSHMSSTNLSLHYHIVFGTNNHEPMIQQAWRGRDDTNRSQTAPLGLESF